MVLRPVDLDHASRLVNHGPTVLIATEHQGRRNLMAAAWPMPVEFTPPRIAVVVDKFAHHGLRSVLGPVLGLPLVAGCAAWMELRHIPELHAEDAYDTVRRYRHAQIDCSRLGPFRAASYSQIDAAQPWALLSGAGLLRPST